MANGGFFANKINKNIRNNDDIYYSALKEKQVNEDKRNVKSVYQKINEIFNSRNYIYKADVVITTNKGQMKKRVIGRNNKNLITDSNEIIPISDIVDIKYQ